MVTVGVFKICINFVSTYLNSLFTLKLCIIVYLNNRRLVIVKLLIFWITLAALVSKLY